MILKLKKGKQKEIITWAITKAGSEIKLSKLIGIPKGSFYRYKFEKHNLPKNRLIILLTFIGKDFDDYRENIEKELPENWGKVKGGLNLIQKKKKEGTFDKTIEQLRKISSERMKKWHWEMKKKYPKGYHLLQYSRFKKIRGCYTFRLKDQTLVRNSLEKEIGDFLLSENISFEYEPYLNTNGKVYFPDFKIGNLVVEVTGWKLHENERLQRMRTKVKKYQENGHKVIFFIPEKLRKFYKELGCPIVSTLPDLKKLLINASVA